MRSSPGAAPPLKDLSGEQYSRLSELLDQSLEMAPAERDVWLAELERSDPRSSAVLRDLFAAANSAQGHGFLEALGPLTHRLASIARAESALIGRQFGPYRVLSLLGQGGMGSVWLAERTDGMFARQIALKLIHPALTGRLMTERLAREREILAGLNHPHIVQLLDAGVSEDGQPYLALEYVAGTPLTAYCDDRRLSVGARLELLQQVLSAVQHAHSHLVIHRDLKPSNILVTPEGQAQILDFGIAKLLTEGEAKETLLTQFGGRALTPDYAAPEQIMGAPITTTADVYALGVILFEILTGERPYRLKRTSRGALEEAILQAEPLTPSRVSLTETAGSARATTVNGLMKLLRGDLDAIVLKALQKSPSERYATANAFGEDIARFLRGDVVLAQRDTFGYRAVKFARRHWIAMAAACALILTLGGGLAATTYEAQVASAQRDAALQAQLRLQTEAAGARLKDGDVPAALGIILEVLPHLGVKRGYTPEALSVFQEARAADAAALIFTGHTDRVRTAAFSPDGRRVVTASFDKTSRIWDGATGREILSLNGHTDWVTSAAFSPDGARIVTSSNDKTARIWDAATGREILSLNGHTGYVGPAAFSPDGQRVLTGSYDKTARIWDAATGREILSLNGHTDWVTSAAFSPEGQRVVTASFDKTARIWDAATGRQTQLLIGHANALRAAAFSPDGQRIVTASKDRTARIWDATTGQQLLLLNGGAEIVTSAVFTPDGRRVVTGSDDGLARIWDASTGQLLLALPGSVSSVAFSPDGRRLIAASDEQAAIWDARAPALDVQTVWAAAAQFAPLAREQRIQLGLPAETEVRQWPLTRTKCDDSAAAPYDPDRRAPGVMTGQILLDIAIPGCADKSDGSGRTPRMVYQRGRAMMASGNFTAARREFEQALAAGYRTAPVDLAMLLSQASAGMLDAPRAISLYQQAWNRGVTVAAFDLGSLYEHGISRAGSGTEHLLDPDPSRAWVWYQKAADAADPDALARFAETNATAALSAENTGKRNAYLLKAFEFYAAAAERARIEDWPDESWRNWRYQRASIARLLAREEMMPAVAHVYDDVRRRYAPHPTLWERVTSSFSSMR